MSNKKVRELQHDTGDIKEHYKMYKVGKFWVYSAISMITFGMGVAFSAGTGFADTTTDSSAAKSANNSNLNSSGSAVSLSSSTSASSAGNSDSTEATSATSTTSASNSAVTAGTSANTDTILNTSAVNSGLGNSAFESTPSSTSTSANAVATSSESGAVSEEPIANTNSLSTNVNSTGGSANNVASTVSSLTDSSAAGVQKVVNINADGSVEVTRALAASTSGSIQYTYKDESGKELASSQVFTSGQNQAGFGDAMQEPVYIEGYQLDLENSEFTMDWGFGTPTVYPLGGEPDGGYSLIQAAEAISAGNNIVSAAIALLAGGKNLDTSGYDLSTLKGMLQYFGDDMGKAGLASVSIDYVYEKSNAEIVGNTQTVKVGDSVPSLASFIESAKKDDGSSIAISSITSPNYSELSTSTPGTYTVELEYFNPDTYEYINGEATLIVEDDSGTTTDPGDGGTTTTTPTDVSESISGTITVPYTGSVPTESAIENGYETGDLTLTLQGVNDDGSDYTYELASGDFSLDTDNVTSGNAGSYTDAFQLTKATKTAILADLLQDDKLSDANSDSLQSLLIGDTVIVGGTLVIEKQVATVDLSGQLESTYAGSESDTWSAIESDYATGNVLTATISLDGDNTPYTVQIPLKDENGNELFEFSDNAENFDAGSYNDEFVLTDAGVAYIESQLESSNGSIDWNATTLSDTNAGSVIGGSLEIQKQDATGVLSGQITENYTGNETDTWQEIISNYGQTNELKFTVSVDNVEYNVELPLQDNSGNNLFEFISTATNFGVGTFDGEFVLTDAGIAYVKDQLTNKNKDISWGNTTLADVMPGGTLIIGQQQATVTIGGQIAADYAGNETDTWNEITNNYGSDNGLTVNVALTGDSNDYSVVLPLVDSSNNNLFEFSDNATDFDEGSYNDDFTLTAAGLAYVEDQLKKTSSSVNWDDTNLSTASAIIGGLLVINAITVSVTYVDVDPNATTDSKNKASKNNSSIKVGGSSGSLNLDIPAGFVLANGSDADSVDWNYTDLKASNFVIEIDLVHDKKSENVSTTRTINYVFADGSQTTTEKTNTVEWTKTTDQVTNDVTYVAQNGQNTYPLEETPVVNGYTADKDEVTAEEFSTDSPVDNIDNETVTVTYYKNSDTIAPGDDNSSIYELEKTVTEQISYEGGQYDDQTATVESVNLYRTVTVTYSYDEDGTQNVEAVAYSDWTTNSNGISTGNETVFDAIDDTTQATLSNGNKISAYADEAGYSKSVTGTTIGVVTTNTNNDVTIIDLVNIDEKDLVVRNINYTADTFTPEYNPNNLTLSRVVNEYVHYAGDGVADGTPDVLVATTTLYRIAEVNDDGGVTYSDWTDEKTANSYTGKAFENNISNQSTVIFSSIDETTEKADDSGLVINTDGGYSWSVTALDGPDTRADKNKGFNSNITLASFSRTDENALNIIRTVTYVSVKADLTVTYVDNDNSKKVVQTIPLTGVINATGTYEVDVPDGYALAPGQSDTVDYQFTTDDSDDITVELVHATTDITPDDTTTGTPDYDETHKDVTIQVTGDAHATISNGDQTIHYTRTATKDDVTGAYSNETDWTTNDNLETVGVDVTNGYTASYSDGSSNAAELNSHIATAVNAAAADESNDATALSYQVTTSADEATLKVTYEDITDPDNSVEVTTSDTSLTGNVDGTGTYNVVVPDGYALANNQSSTVDYKFTADDSDNITVNLVHATTDITPDNTTTGTQDYDETHKDVTIQVNGDNHVTISNGDQTIHYTRTATKDDVTGAYSNETDWTTSDNLETVGVDVTNGYTASYSDGSSDAAELNSHIATAVNAAATDESNEATTLSYQVTTKEVFTTTVTNDPDGGTTTTTTDGHDEVTEIVKNWPDGDKTDVVITTTPTDPTDPDSPT
ncbi:mucin-binding protein, partial [Paucilactobacillus suebicus]